jgi:hypothetical protein
MKRSPIRADWRRKSELTIAAEGSTWQSYVLTWTEAGLGFLGANFIGDRESGTGSEWSRSLAVDTDPLLALDLDGQVVELADQFLDVLGSDSREIHLDALFVKGLIDARLGVLRDKGSPLEPARTSLIGKRILNRIFL